MPVPGPDSGQTLLRMTRFERGCRLNSISAPAYRPLDPTAVCFLFDTALPQNPKPET